MLETGTDAGPIGWYSELALSEKRTFWGCFLGWVLDAMDVQIYGLALGAIGATFALDKTQSGLIGTVTLFTSAFGGWLAGLVSDRVGRVRMLQLTVAWFAIFTFLCGLAQNYPQFLVLRALMGFGFGGEWAAGAVLMGEVIRARHRGKAVGCVQAGWAVGWGVALILWTLLSSTLAQEHAWRVLFMLGIAPAFLVFFVRRFVHEPEVFIACRAGDEKGAGNPLEIFSPAMLKTTILCALLATGAQGGYYAITTWLPSFLKDERNLPVVGSFPYLAIIIAGSFLGYIASAYLCDLIGRRANFVLFAAASFVIALIYTQIPMDDSLMLVLGLPLGFFASGVFSGMGPFLTENFPTRMRGSGQGFSYNFGRGISAWNVTFVGMLSARLSLGHSIGVFAGIAYALVVVAALLLPETKGRELTAG
ncbi:MAG: MFS transporter [Methylobacteriaceae bacterium]|nr:MFS transporter [Methylobacteriaceae bacterium]